MPTDINILLVKVKANAREDSIVGWENDWLKIKVHTAPEKGQANHAVRKLLAQQAGVGIDDISIISGLTSSKKKILLSPESLLFFKNNYQKKNPAN
jgi:hypothetical protein